MFFLREYLLFVIGCINHYKIVDIKILLHISYQLFVLLETRIINVSLFAYNSINFVF